MFITTLVLLFLFKLRFPKNKPISRLLTSRYGVNTLKCFRRFEQSSNKLCKAQKDLEFLISCKAYHVFPRFLSFKLYKKTLCNTEMYRSWQTKLLDIEIKCKRKLVQKHEGYVVSLKNNLKLVVSLLDYYALVAFVSRKIDHLVLKISSIHERKLLRLGACSGLKSCDPSKVIFNYSNRILSQREKYLLSFGLDFCLPVFKPSFYRYFLAFESFVSRLQQFQLAAGYNFSNVIRDVKTIASKHFYNFKSHKVFSPIFSKSDFNLLKDLGKDKDIVVCKPDKGRGVVLLNKTDYITKMKDILSDFTKFTLCQFDDVFSVTQKIEDKVSRFLRKLTTLGTIDNDDLRRLMPHGSSPAVMYGLPKVHKAGVPLRPILAAYNTPSFHLAKFVVPILSEFTVNEYTLKNSYEFFDSMSSLHLPNSFFMASFDIQSLFTNVPLDETINICIKHLFNDSSNFLGMTKNIFKNLMSLCVKDFYFLFDGVLYKQIDGVGMGSPLGPTLANVFLCYHEKSWLEDCPAEFKPLVYRRYVDDTFVIFKEQHHASLFLNYLNSKHRNIRFTSEFESNGQLPFLDLLVGRKDGGLVFSIYRKPTFSGLGTSFFSFCSLKFKLNAIKTLLHRAFHLSSTFEYFHKEVMFLRNFFQNNGFNKNVFDKYVNRCLNNHYQPKIPVPTVKKLDVFVSLPFLGEISTKIENELQKCLSRFYPQLNFRFVFVNNFKIGSFFRFKDRLPTPICSSVIYKFECPNCPVGEYYGSTYRALKIRIDEHIGQSSRTGFPLSSPPQSEVRDHSIKCNFLLKFEHFKIVDYCNSAKDLRILESLYIKQCKPRLNCTSSATPLLVCS